MGTRARSLGRYAVAMPSLLALGLVPPTTEPSGTDPSGVTSGPIVTSSKVEAEPGQRTVLTIDGFMSPYVQMSICGNEARRGSADCNMSGSQAIEVHGDAPVRIEFPVTEPPAPCPCVIRVTGQDVSEIAITPFVIIGHPIAAVQAPAEIGDVVAVAISAKEAPQGAWDAVRSGLGGRTTYAVTIRVKNLATTPLKNVQLSASAGRSKADDSLVELDIADPGLLGVGQTWEQTKTVEVPAPVFGKTEWRAAVVGAGRTVVATTTTMHRPVLLLALAVLIMLNVGAVLMRWRMRKHAAREAFTDDSARPPVIHLEFVKTARLRSRRRHFIGLRFDPFTEGIR
jgi:hypothetical protein